MLRKPAFEFAPAEEGLLVLIIVLELAMIVSDRLSVVVNLIVSTRILNYVTWEDRRKQFMFNVM